MPPVFSRQAEKARKAKALEKARANPPARSEPSPFDRPKKKRKAAAPVEDGAEGGDIDQDWEDRPAQPKKAKKPKMELAPILPEIAPVLTPAEVAAALRATEEDIPVASPDKKVKSAKRPPGAVKKDKKSKKAEPVVEIVNTVVKESTPVPVPGSPPAVVEDSSPAAPVVSKVAAPKSVVPSPFLAQHSIALSEPLEPIVKFSKLPISSILASALGKFKSPTPIQACAWSALLVGRDVVGIAETGSGKTLGFGIPALEHLAKLPESSSSKKATPSVLVVSPTRELAIQTWETLAAIAKPLKAKCVCIYGGASKEEQEALLSQQGVRVVVATPGRLIDMLNDQSLSLSKVSYLVLDEADRMLDTGFEDDVRKIFAAVPKARQTAMFSATWPESVQKLANEFMKKPVRITVGSSKLAATRRVEQTVEVLNNDVEKEPRLLAILQAHFARANPKQPLRIVVFALYKKEAVRLELLLRKAGYKVAGLHGDMLQAERSASLEAFKKAKVNVLVATDVAARGLDVPDVSLVINVTFPLNVEDYVHRIGRAGRGGKNGKAITLFTGAKHERTLAGPFIRVLEEAGVTIPKEMDKFPRNIISKRERMKTFFADKDARRAAGELH